MRSKPILKVGLHTSPPPLPPASALIVGECPSISLVNAQCSVPSCDREVKEEEGGGGGNPGRGQDDLQTGDLFLFITACESNIQQSVNVATAGSWREPALTPLSLSLPQRRAAERASKLKVGARYYETHNVKNKNRDKKMPVLEGKKGKKAKR